MTMPRRALLSAFGLASAAILTGCTKDQRHPDSTPTKTSTATDTSRPPTRAAAQPAPSRPSTGRRRAAVEYANGSRSRPQVALTFHGAGDPVLAHDLLAVLAEHGVRVTVFAVGSWLEANPTIASPAGRCRARTGQSHPAPPGHRQPGRSHGRGGDHRLPGSAPGAGRTARTVLSPVAGAACDSAGTPPCRRGGLPGVRVLRRGLPRLHRPRAGNRPQAGRDGPQRFRRQSALRAPRHGPCAAGHPR